MRRGVGFVLLARASIHMTLRNRIRRSPTLAASNTDAPMAALIIETDLLSVQGSVGFLVSHVERKFVFSESVIRAGPDRTVRFSWGWLPGRQLSF